MALTKGLTRTHHGRLGGSSKPFFKREVPCDIFSEDSGQRCAENTKWGKVVETATCSRWTWWKYELWRKRCNAMTEPHLVHLDAQKPLALQSIVDTHVHDQYAYSATGWPSNFGPTKTSSNNSRISRVMHLAAISSISRKSPAKNSAIFPSRSKGMNCLDHFLWGERRSGGSRVKQYEWKQKAEHVKFSGPSL